MLRATTVKFRDFLKTSFFLGKPSLYSFSQEFLNQRGGILDLSPLLNQVNIREKKNCLSTGYPMKLNLKFLSCSGEGILTF